MNMTRANEFGEEISEEELTNFAERARKLSDEKIDELWHLCQFISAEREEKFKAVAQYYIDRIRESLDSAKEMVWSLIAETPMEEFKKNLSKVEE